MDKEQMRAERLEYYRSQAQEYHFTREYNKAMSFYIRAGLLGDLDSIREVCVKIKNGYGMSYNYNELFRCMEIGAKAGIPYAMYELAICYSNGIGTEIDRGQAMRWYSESAKAGNRDAKNALDTYQAGIRIEIQHDVTRFAYEVRKQIFVEEQGFVEDLDEIDQRADHYVVFDGQKAIGVCRLYWDEGRKSFVLGRFGIIRDYRGSGIGTVLMKKIEKDVRNRQGKQLILHSQLHAKGFYEKMGFVTEGEIEEEQGVPHVWMVRKIYES